MAIPKQLHQFLLSLEGHRNEYLQIDGIEIDEDGDYVLSTTALDILHPGMPQDSKEALYWMDYIAERALLCISYHVLIHGDESLYSLIEEGIEDYMGSEGFYFCTQIRDDGCIMSASCMIEVSKRGRLMVDGAPRDVILDAMVMLVDEWKKARAALASLDIEITAEKVPEHRVYH